MNIVVKFILIIIMGFFPSLTSTRTQNRVLTYLPYIKTYKSQYKASWLKDEWILAIIDIESDGNPYRRKKKRICANNICKRVVINSQYYGAFQFGSKPAQDIGVKAKKCHGNKGLSTKYWIRYMAKYKRLGRINPTYPLSIPLAWRCGVGCSRVYVKCRNKSGHKKCLKGVFRHFKFYRNRKHQRRGVREYLRQFKQLYPIYEKALKKRNKDERLQSQHDS